MREVILSLIRSHFVIRHFEKEMSEMDNGLIELMCSKG